MEDKIDLTDLRVKSFTVSYTFKHQGDHFISMGFDIPSPISTEEFEVLNIKANYLVTKAAIYAAIGRSNLSIDQANQLIQMAKHNTNILLKKKAPDERPAHCCTPIQETVE
jgi:hypothetical protein